MKPATRAPHAQSLPNGALRAQPDKDHRFCVASRPLPPSQVEHSPANCRSAIHAPDLTSNTACDSQPNARHQRPAQPVRCMPLLCGVDLLSGGVTPRRLGVRHLQPEHLAICRLLPQGRVFAEARGGIIGNDLHYQIARAGSVSLMSLARRAHHAIASRERYGPAFQAPLPRSIQHVLDFPLAGMAVMRPGPLAWRYPKSLAVEGMPRFLRLHRATNALRCSLRFAFQ